MQIRATKEMAACAIDEVIDHSVGLLRSLGRDGQQFALRAVAARLNLSEALCEQNNAAAQLLEVLSKREREVFGFVVEGHKNADIACALCISIKTVETHRGRIFKKLNVHSVDALVRVAARAGLLGATVVSLRR
jgi:DNA-binding NarL/FixJ family response regulator